MKKVHSLLDISSNINTFFVDVYGVLWDGNDFYPESLSICHKLLQENKRVYILSNTTKTSSYFKEKNVKKGLIQGIHYTDVITSGDLLKYELEHHNFLDNITKSKTGKYLLIGYPNDFTLESVLHRQTTDVKKAKAVYIGALQTVSDGKTILYQNLDPFIELAKKALELHLPAICANPDYFAFSKGVKFVTQGNLGKWYEENGGKVYWFGKPYKNLYDYVLGITGCSPSSCAMVGDTIRTDILGGFNAGMKTVLILKNGVTQDILNQGGKLDDIIKQEGVQPDFLLDVLK